STEPCGTHPRFAAYLGTPHAVAMRCAGRRDRLEPVPLENPDARAKSVPAKIRCSPTPQRQKIKRSDDRKDVDFPSLRENGIDTRFFFCKAKRPGDRTIRRPEGRGLSEPEGERDRHATLLLQREEARRSNDQMTIKTKT